MKIRYKQLFLQKGFTLIEMLIVVIVLAIMAAIIIPQFGSSTEDANISALKAQLKTMRNAIELYYHQHNSRYPGRYRQSDGASQVMDNNQAIQSFSRQLTLYTDKNGKVSGTKDATFKYGPYLKALSLPKNPFFDGLNASRVICDLIEDDVTVVPSASGTTGWKFYILTGRFIANDNTTLSDGTTKTSDF